LALRCREGAIHPISLNFGAGKGRASRLASRVWRYDGKTGKPYRVYHALPDSRQLHLFVYVDIDEATRNQMLKSAVNRREQMVSDGYNLTLDLEHWNSVNPDKEPIQLPMDLEFDIDLRKASEDGEGSAA